MPKRHTEPLPSLPDYLRPGLRLVFVGTNPGRLSAARGHYFARTGNPFWPLLFDAGLVGERLRADDDWRLPDFGIGLTDLVKRPTGGIADLTPADYAAGLPAFVRKIVRLAPRVVCFVGQNPYRRVFGLKPGVQVRYGLQAERLGESLVFVVPSTSGRFPMPYAERLRVFEELKALLASLSLEPSSAGGRRSPPPWP